jgi:TonB family protein
MDLARKALCSGLLAGVLTANLTWAAPRESPGDAYRRGDFARAMELLKPQAEAGGIDAQIMLGQMYLKGEGVKADAAKAIAWMRRAADEGSSIAAFDLGVFASSGIGGPQDNQAAAAWYRKAAHQRYPDAAYNLAVLYNGGQGVARSDPMALNWIDAGIRYLPPSAGEGLKTRFAALRGAIMASMTPEQISAAARLVSPDGPVASANIRERAELMKKGLKDYPVALRHLGRGGTVVLVLLVHPDGSVGDTVVETSSGHPDLDVVTQHLMASAKIEPQRINGEPIESWQLAEFTWRAKEEPWNSNASLNALPRPH